MNVNKLRVLSKRMVLIGVILFLVSFFKFYKTPSFYIHYISVFSFFFSLSIGACFIILLQSLMRAGWIVVVKRIPEHIMSLLPLFALFFIPILFGVDQIFEWLDPHHIAEDILIQKKQAYLNLPFFIIRNIIYFATWSYISHFYWKTSIDQDNAITEEEQQEYTKKQQRKAPVAIFMLSITTSFASFDWIMSLFPHWFSTIFGIYYFAGSMVFFFAATILVYEILIQLKLLTNAPNVEHFHDLSKLLYGFIIFWAYVSFSQYFLTWYANIPEFTQWYYPRIHGEWESLFFILIIFHFIVPLFGFMSRHVKRNRLMRILFSIMMIGLHYLDIRFMIYPNFPKQFPINEISSTEIWLIVSFGLIIIGALFNKIGRYKIIPVNDPRLKESMKLENAL